MNSYTPDSVRNRMSAVESPPTGGRIVVRGLVGVVAVLFFVFSHEGMHWLVGRLFGIPAVFTSLVSVGVPPADIHHYPLWTLTLMNGIAPWYSVGFVALALWLSYRLSDRHGILVDFFRWTAIAGAPYLGLQLIGGVVPAKNDGSGVDFAAINAFFNLSAPIPALLSLIGSILLVAAAILVRKTVFAPVPIRSGLVAPWRRAAGVALIVIFALITIACCVAAAIGNYAYALTPLLAWITLFSGALILWIPWKQPASRAFLLSWGFPGGIVVVAMAVIGILTEGDLLVSGLVVAPTLLTVLSVLNPTRRSGRVSPMA